MDPDEVGESPVREPELAAGEERPRERLLRRGREHGETREELGLLVEAKDRRSVLPGERALDRHARLGALGRLELGFRGSGGPRDWPGATGPDLGRPLEPSRPGKLLGRKELREQESREEAAADSPEVSREADAGRGPEEREQEELLADEVEEEPDRRDLPGPRPEEAEPVEELTLPQGRRRT